MIEQGPAQPAAGAARINRDLLHVQAAFDHLSKEKPGRAVIQASDHPQPAGLLVGSKILGGPQDPRDLRHADIVEHSRWRPVDVLNGGQLRRPCK
jgi:hypothetical protein